MLVKEIGCLDFPTGAEKGNFLIETYEIIEMCQRYAFFFKDTF